MKILSTYSIVNSRNTTFHAKDFKPIFKSEISGEIISNATENIENHHDLFGWFGGIIAGAAAIFALIKGRKTKTDLKNKSKVLTEEKDSIDKSIEKLKQSLDELKNKNKNLDKELEELKKQETQINNSSPTVTEKTNIHVGNNSGIEKTSKRKTKTEASSSNTSSSPLVQSEVKSSKSSKSTSDSFEERVKDFQENFTKKVEVLENEMESLQGIKTKTDIAEMLAKINEIKGFERIQGYSNIKDFFNKTFIVPLKKKDNKSIPNLILMYGPQGTGKTLFANELVNEANCNRIKLDLDRDERINITELKKKLKEAQNVYKLTGRNSLIQIDELDVLAFKNKELQKEFFNLVNNLSEKYHSTIIATTNSPQYIDKVVLGANKLETVYIAPPNKEDIAQILKFVCQYIADTNINYEELAEQITKKAGKNFYSSARIYKFVNNIVEQHQSFTTKLTQEELIKYIENDLAQADILGSNLDEYKSFFSNQRAGNVAGNIKPDAFEQKVTEATNELKHKMNMLQQDMQQVQNVMDKSSISELLTKLDNIKGFERIQGFNKIKEFFNLKFIEPIKNNDKNIPNVVLMYGPQGTGKTLFAKELAYEIGAEHVEMEISRDALQNLQNLNNIANNAKQSFENSGKRTIVQIDELDALTIGNNDIQHKFSELLNNLSNSYYSTVIATTNNPQYLDRNILQIQGLEKIYVSPAQKQDIADILKFVGTYIGEPNVDYNKLADLVLIKAGNDAYSSARIYKFITSVIAKQPNLSKKLSQKEFETIVKKDLLPPDINQKELENYQNIFKEIQ